MRNFSRFMVCLFILALPVLAGAAAKKDEGPPEPRLLPWKLRDHYTMSPDGFAFIYGGDNGQWSLSKGDNLLLDKVNSGITLADGTTIETAMHGVGTTTRRDYEGEVGPGIEYIVNIPAKNGISLRHSLAYHKEHPFYVLRLEVKNEGTAPIEIAKISPVIIPPGSLKGLGADVSVSHRRFEMHGPCPQFSKDAEPYATFIHDATGLLLGFGSLPREQSHTTVDLQPFSGAWQGSITSVFDPPVRLDPGQTIQADPAWISFITPTPKDVDLFCAHACKDFPRPARPDAAPTAWVTVPDGGSLADLQAARANWPGIAAALVPVTWEGRGGSQEGAAPDWPREMRGVASQLKQGGSAGITVDPLASMGGDAAWTAKSEDGQGWLNPAVAEGMAHGVDQLKKIVGWGFDFYVVAESRIPNEVLKHFNISRAQADSLAMKMMITAAAGAPVFASSQGSALGGERDEWLAAAGATARLSEYGVVTAPVRFDPSKGEAIDDETATAIAFCGAPVEVIGNPSSSVQRAISDAVSRRDFFARPLDLGSPVPLLWQVETTPNGPSSLAITVVSFKGARASASEDLVTYSGTPAKTSNADAAGYVAQLPAGKKKR